MVIVAPTATRSGGRWLVGSFEQTLPPTVPRFRTWTSAIDEQTSARIGRAFASAEAISSLVVVIAYFELTVAVQTIYSRTFQTIPLLIVAALWYLALTSVLSIGQMFIERRFGRGFAVGGS